MPDLLEVDPGLDELKSLIKSALFPTDHERFLLLRSLFIRDTQESHKKLLNFFSHVSLFSNVPIRLIFF